MEGNRKIAYSEVYAILENMNPLYKNKIPEHVWKIIIEEMDKTYRPVIQLDVPLESQNLNTKTYTVLAALYIEYWCESDDERQELLKLYDNNEKMCKGKFQIDFDADLVFKKEEPVEYKSEETKEMVVYKENILSKILNKIKYFFKK